MANGSRSTWNELTGMIRQRVGTGTGEAFQAALENCLVPLVRVALVHGRGPQAILNWLDGETAKYPGLDRKNLARPLARTLGEHLLNRFDPLPSRETVVGT